MTPGQSDGCSQAVRNPQDLNCMAVPHKYREIGDFHEYYSGARKAPFLTVFVGGNHEASSHLFELYYGGWVAPNIYYLGAANVVRLGALRIAGLSGIWKGYNFNKTHHERLPYSQDDVRSIYHVRELDVRKLVQVRSQVDVGISHDWPRAVEWHGDYKTLFKKKNDFEAESRDGTLGSVAARRVFDRLRPAYWFAAHLHVKFAAMVNHEESKDQLARERVQGAHATASYSDDTDAKTQGQHGQWGPSHAVRNEDEIDLEMDDSEEESTLKDQEPAPKPQGQAATTSTVPQSIRDQLPSSFSVTSRNPQKTAETAPPTDITNETTNFLALDKCLPGRKFLQLLEVQPASQRPEEIRCQADEGKLRLSYDKEWLAITRVFAAELVLGDRHATVPPNRGEAHYRPLIEAEEAWIEEHVVTKGGLLIPEDFEPTAPPYESVDPASADDPADTPDSQPPEYNNPQTARFCDMIGIENRFFLTDEQRDERMKLAEQTQQSGSGRRAGNSRGWGRGRGGGWRGAGGRGHGHGHGRGRGRGSGPSRSRGPYRG